MLPVAATSRPPLIERSSPKRGASLVANMPAAKTTMTVPAKNSPNWIGVKCSPSIRTRSAAENIANNPPRIRLTVACGTKKRRSDDEAEIVLGDGERVEPGSVSNDGFHRARRRSRWLRWPQTPRPERTRSAEPK